jgi:hypothetical protein
VPRSKKENRRLNALKQISMVRVGGVVVMAFVGGALSFALAVSGVVRTKNPQAALAIMPTESTALAARADQLLFANPTKLSPAITNLARQALIQQSANAKAVRLLGYVADMKGDSQRALALIKMSERLSRRDVGAQMWLIEHHARANDTVETLQHYDIVLTTTPNTQPILFPRLSNAIGEASIRTALMPYIRQERGWANAFLTYAINDKKALTSTVALVSEARKLPGSENSRSQLITLLGRLVAENRFEDARLIYGLVPGAKQARLIDPAFDDSDRDTNFGIMGWSVLNEPDAGGGFSTQKSDVKPSLSIYANSGNTRVVATKLLYLQPGKYQLLIKLSRLERGDGGYLQFRLRCPAQTPSTPFWILGLSTKFASSPLPIPGDCQVQLLEIVASGGKGQLGMEAVVDSIAISR